MLPGMNHRLIKIGAGVAAAVVIALGGMAIARGSGNSAEATGNGFPGGPGAPDGYGFGGRLHDDRDDVTGTTAGKVTDAVKAKYPKATVRGIHHLPDGSYLALAVEGNDLLPVHVSKDFKVLGTLARGPGDPDHDHHGFGPGPGSMPSSQQ